MWPSAMQVAGTIAGFIVGMPLAIIFCMWAYKKR